MSSQPSGRGRRVFFALTASIALVVSAGSAVALGTYLAVRNRGGSIVVQGGSNAPILGKCNNDVCNYLLLGSDSRKGLSKAELEHFGTDKDIGGENRADTIMLVHTDPKLQKAIILSFPRDLWVQIPGHGYDKINAAFQGGVEHGGPELVAKTIHKLTGLKIAHVLYVDLAGFQGVVDALGGVDMCIPTDVQDELTGLDLKAGCQLLDGKQALAYVRTRHLPCDTVPDFARIGRQQQFLRAVINRMLQPAEIAQAPSLVGPILSHLVRDNKLDPTQLAYLVGQMKGASTGGAEFRAVPGTAGWEGDLSVVHMDPAATKIFAAIRQGKPLGTIGATLPGQPISEANIVVPVVDHGSGGNAGQVEKVLSEGGFDVAPGVIDYGSYGSTVKGSVIAYTSGHDQWAAVVQQYFPDLRVVEVKKKELSDPVAVFVTPSYVPKPVGSDAPSPTDCVSAG